MHQELSDAQGIGAAVATERQATQDAAALAKTNGAPIELRGQASLSSGWIMLGLATMVMLASTPGQTFGLAFFIPHFRGELDLTSTQVSSLYLAATLLAALPLTHLGGLVDRYGLRRSTLAAVIAMGGACWLTSVVHSATMLLVGFWAMRLFGAGTLSIVANNTLAACFDRRLGVATSVMQLGVACAMAFAPGALLWMIEWVGWRQTYVWTAAGIAGLMGPLVWFAYREKSPRACAATQHVHVAHDPSSLSRRMTPSLTLRQAVRTPTFWTLHASIGLWALIGTALMFHLEAIFRTRQCTPQQSAWATTVLAIGMAGLQLSGGVLSDRMGVRRLLAIALAGIATGCATIALSRSAMSLLAGYALFGGGQGLMTIVSATSWPRYFGRAHLGQIRGSAMTSAVACSSMGPLALGWSMDRLGGIEPALWTFALLTGVAAVAAKWTSK